MAAVRSFSLASVEGYN